jgi:hypothetical protein
MVDTLANFEIQARNIMDLMMPVPLPFVERVEGKETRLSSTGR